MRLSFYIGILLLSFVFLLDAAIVFAENCECPAKSDVLNAEGETKEDCFDDLTAICNSDPGEFCTLGGKECAVTGGIEGIEWDESEGACSAESCTYVCEEVYNQPPYPERSACQQDCTSDIPADEDGCTDAQRCCPVATPEFNSDHYAFIIVIVIMVSLLTLVILRKKK
jgi:hypothetical protein